MGISLRVIELAYKDHLCRKTTALWSLGWSLYTSFTVYCILLKAHILQNIFKALR